MAYDLKSVSLDMVRQRALRTGDGSHPVWGWGDKDQKSEDIGDTGNTQNGDHQGGSKEQHGRPSGLREE